MLNTPFLTLLFLLFIIDATTAQAKLSYCSQKGEGYDRTAFSYDIDNEDPLKPSVEIHDIPKMDSHRFSFIEVPRSRSKTPFSAILAVMEGDGAYGGPYDTPVLSPWGFLRFAETDSDIVLEFYKLSVDPYGKSHTLEQTLTVPKSVCKIEE